MPNPTIGTRRLPQAPQAPARPQFGPGNMPALPPTPLTGVPKMGVPAGAAFAVPAVLDAAPGQTAAMIVMPPMMPPLPATPAASPWAATRNPSAHLVQQRYVDLRLEELAAQWKPGQQAAILQLELKLLQEPRFQKYNNIPPKELLRTYQQVERNLQSADLTINFEVQSWFGQENTYETYTQMYQRAVVDGKMKLKSTGLNIADRRGEVDNQVTFPENWQGAQTPPQRGLTPGRQGADRVMRQMDTGNMVPVAGAHATFTAENPHFNPNTKQIFMGLNYGRRPHGSSKRYGRSYFVLKSSLKARCLYYACDTFDYAGTDHHAGNLQVTYDNLGAILGKGATEAKMAENPWANAKWAGIRSAIFESCYQGKILLDSDSPSDLLEAHHFGELRFREHVEYMVISRGDATPDAWFGYVENARKFAGKHGFKLYQTN